MPNTLSVLWTVEPLFAPRPWLPCGRCGLVTAFRSSGRFRVNANGRRVDAWLVYRCGRCEKSWNRPLLERQPVASLDPGLLPALLANDAATARAVAFDLADLRRRAERVEILDRVEIRRLCRAGVPEAATRLDIELRTVRPVGLRLDRLLADGLGVPRARIGALQDAGHLTLPARRALRRPPPERSRLAVDLGDLPDAAAIARAAAGG